ncbi:circularly permuted type 2 ATP-grasp protein [Nocardioides sp. NPDC004968]|uniref:circularly permuted type 2 ATP-grasp protein n=1 Tax=Nocardioides sp. NPDC004968 TaxID=3155894 RepID=UPI0033A9F5E5
MTVLREYADALGILDATDQPYDEVVGPDGTLRPAWKPMAETAVSITPATLSRIGHDVERFLADDGVTYLRPGAKPEPWRLDPVPLVIDPAQWRILEVGLAQRAELLNAILVDLYGPQRLLQDGIVPAPVIFGHHGFHRVAARASNHDPRPLVLAATDLGRTPDGEWRVLADRTQAPSGIGYAMENRRVISRVLPELHRDAGLHRMEPYFAALRSALLESAPGDQADPRVVVLSPGTHSETAYDQAFLASTLGFPLVQGADLTVRNGEVLMRGHGDRLERVDVILRRVDATWSDPLELRGDSQLGVAGLIEAVRRGNVRVVNGFGAGVLENPGLVPYLPAACEALLGEPLRLASLGTWWCGDPAQREEVERRLATDDLVVRTLEGTIVNGTPEELGARIAADPYRHVGQERITLSQAPTWAEGRGAVGRPLTLRTFSLRYGSAYRPLVGGLASIRADETGLPPCSKDVWVLKESPQDADQGLADVLPMTHSRSVTVLVPRALEDMYWSGRYAERAEDLIRLILATHVLAEDFRTRPRTSGGISLEVMLSALDRLGGHGHADADIDAEFRSMLLDADRPGSAAQSLAGMRQVFSGVRDQLSPDMWRIFSSTDRAADELRVNPHSLQIAESGAEMLHGILAMQGIVASMIRDEGYHSIRLGRFLERSMQVCQLLRTTTTVRRGLEVDRAVLNAVLASAESAVTHRRRYRGYVRTGGVLDLLIMDRDNPRSLAFCLRELRLHLTKLPGSTGSSRPERLLDDITDMLDRTEVAGLVAIGGVGRPNLESFLDQVQAQLVRLAEAISDVHFATGPAPQPLNALPAQSHT